MQTLRPALLATCVAAAAALAQPPEIGVNPTWFYVRETGR